ncbi:MAG: helix-turn-helix domain-containing protein [Segetibacter sp.]
MDKKEQIILAAMKLFIENDIQATPMSAIAKAAKTGMGTIYNYFATKEELINSIFIYIKLDQHKHITKTFTNESIKKQFEYYYLSFNQFLLDNPPYFFLY